MGELAEPGVLDRLRARFGWLDHVVRAFTRFNDRNGSLFAAGLTYYTIFAIFPLLMVGFGVGGFALSRRPELLTTLEERIRTSVSGAVGQQLVDLMNSAIDARASVGVIGLATAAWVGLGWMWHLREALSQMWAHPVAPAGYLRTKLSDLAAMVGTFVVIVATIALTVLGHARPMAAVLRWLEIPQFSVFDEIFRGISVLVSVLVSWVLFTWMIGRLPREPVGLGHRGAGRVDGGGRLRAVQAGGGDLPADSVAQPGGRGVRAGAGVDGVRVRHRVADPVRHRVGGDGFGVKPVGQPAYPATSRRECR